MTPQPLPTTSPPSNEQQESTLEWFLRLSADPQAHFCWTDEFLESLPPRSESELQALGSIRF
jgi:hypothetical protein